LNAVDAVYVLLVLAVVVSLCGLGFAVWAVRELRQLRRASTASAPPPVDLTALAPLSRKLSEERVLKLVADGLKQYELETSIQRYVIQAMLDQSAREIVSKMHYDKVQRRTAIEQRLTRICHTKGIAVPSSAMNYLHGQL
jgi:hypothetical protein